MDRGTRDDDAIGHSVGHAGHAGFQGTANAFLSSLSGEPLLIAAALVTIYIILGVLYESVVHPITILSTLPSAGIGALLILMAVNLDFSVIAMIGVIVGFVALSGVGAYAAEPVHQDQTYESCASVDG